MATKRNEPFCDENMEVLSRFQQLFKEIGSLMYERENEIEGIALSLLAKEHILFVGSHGVGKSMLMECFKVAVPDLSTYENQFSAFTDPTEVFGPYDIQAFKAGKFRRVIGEGEDEEAFLPMADIATLDEFLDAVGPTLRGINTVLNERIYNVGAYKHKCPLITAMAATNKPIDAVESAMSTVDRFMLRYIVEAIKSPENMKNLILDVASGSDSKRIRRAVKTRLTYEDLELLIWMVTHVEFPEELAEKMVQIWLGLGKEGIKYSDRRGARAVIIVLARALFSGRTTASAEDLEVLKHCFWTSESQRRKVAAVVGQQSSPVNFAINDGLAEAEEVYARLAALSQSGMESDKLAEKGLEGSRVLRKIMKDIGTLAQRFPASKDKCDSARIAVNEKLQMIINQTVDPNAVTDESYGNGY